MVEMVSHLQDRPERTRMSRRGIQSGYKRKKDGIRGIYKKEARSMMKERYT
jgi:hypothetical protein